MLTKPLLLTIDTFDTRDAVNIKFQVIGGDQIFYNELEIYENSTNAKVYGKIIKTFAFEHTLEIDSLANLGDYYAKIRTYDKDNNYSVWSDIVYFRCFQKPVVTIPQLDNGKVNNQTLLVQSVFKSPQDSLKSYRYILFNDRKIKIAESNNLYDGLLQYEFTGLVDDSNYYVECIVQTQNNVYASSGLIHFIADFVAPRVKTIFSLTNNYENASVKLEAKIIQMFWKSKNETYNFENDTMINLNNDVIYLDDGEVFSIDKDFTFEIILSNIKEEVPFARFLGKYGELEFTYFNNRIHGYKKLNGIKDKRRYIHYMTSECISILETDTIFLHVQSEDNALSMRMAKIV